MPYALPLLKALARSSMLELPTVGASHSQHVALGVLTDSCPGLLSALLLGLDWTSASPVAVILRTATGTYTACPIPLLLR